MRIKSCIQCWCDKHGLTTLSFSERKQVVISATDENTSYLSTKVTTAKGKNTLKLKVEIITEELKMRSVVVPIDKTSDKVVFVC